MTNFLSHLTQRHSENTYIDLKRLEVQVLTNCLPVVELSRAGRVQELSQPPPQPPDGVEPYSLRHLGGLCGRYQSGTEEQTRLFGCWELYVLATSKVISGYRLVTGRTRGDFIVLSYWETRFLFVYFVVVLHRRNSISVIAWR